MCVTTGDDENGQGAKRRRDETASKRASDFLVRFPNRISVVETDGFSATSSQWTSDMVTTAVAVSLRRRDAHRCGAPTETAP